MRAAGKYHGAYSESQAQKRASATMYETRTLAQFVAQIQFAGPAFEPD
jgi:hypothetical protein